MHGREEAYRGGKRLIARLRYTSSKRRIEASMPTIHIYLPDDIYERLKQLAARKGLKAAQLAKLLIVRGIEAYEKGADAAAEAGAEREAAEASGKVNEAVLEKLLQLQMQLEKMREAMEERMIELEEQIFALQDEVRRLKAKVSKLEDAYEDLVHPVEIETTNITR